MKVYDITPPKLEEREVVSVSQAREPKKPRSFSSVFKKYLAASLLVFSIFCLILYSLFFEPKTEIEIGRETELASFTVEIKVSDSIKESEPLFWLEQKSIPGQLLAVESSFSRQFSSTGVFLREEKAHGTIRVYNNYSVTDQPLLANTRFISDTGKLFRTLERVVIPGMHYEEGKLVQGWIDAEVVAAEAGEEYNIGSATFSIPGFAGTAKYTSFYGKSFSEMTGGLRAEAPRVTEKDLEEAKKNLTEGAFEQGKTDLTNKFGQDFELLEKAIKQEVVEFLPLAQKNQELKTFVAQLKVKTEVLGFKKSDLNGFIETYINSELPEGKKFLEESLKFSYSFLRAKDNEIELGVGAEVLTCLNIDREQLKRRVRGRALLEVSGFLKSEPGISEVKIRNQPFWAKTVSGDLERIEIVDKF